jgi:hypothetical protein
VADDTGVLPIADVPSEPMHSMQQSIARMAAADDGNWGHMGWVEEVHKESKSKAKERTVRQSSVWFGVRLLGQGSVSRLVTRVSELLCNTPRRVSATEDLITFGFGWRVSRVPRVL